MGERYTTQATSGFDASPPSDDASETEANKVKYSTIKDKLATPVKDRGDNIDTALLALLDEGPDTKSTTYTTVATDHNKVIESSGTFTLSLLDAATAGAGYRVTVKNNGAGVVTVDTDTVADEIDGEVSLTLTAKESVTCIVNNAADGYYRESINISTPIDETKGGTGQTTITAGDVLYGSAANTLSKLAKGSDGEYLTLSSGVPAWAAIIQENDLVLLQTQSISTDATVDFVDGTGGAVIDTTYDHYLFILTAVRPATDATSLYVRISDDTGVSFEAGASDYEYNVTRQISSTAGVQSGANSQGAAQIQTTHVVGNAATEAISGVIHLHNPGSAATYMNIFGDLVYWSSDGTPILTHASSVGGYNAAATAVDGIRFLMSSGNLTSGTIALYGVVKS